MSYTDEETIKSYVEEIAKYGYCKIDGENVYERDVIRSMLSDRRAIKVILMTINGLRDESDKLTISLYDEHARDLVVDALASVEGKE